MGMWGATLCFQLYTLCPVFTSCGCAESDLNHLRAFPGARYFIFPDGALVVDEVHQEVILASRLKGGHVAPLNEKIAEFLRVKPGCDLAVFWAFN